MCTGTLQLTFMLVCPITFEPVKMWRSCTEMSVIPTQLKELNPSVNNVEKLQLLICLSPYLQPGVAGSFLSSEKQAAPAATHSDNAHFQAMASSQESILRLGVSHELPHLATHL